ncbi:MAG: glycosyltransferase family 2 protein [Bacteroidales bacterium]|nr:glycosyltransferase family 2 protein [Bacteroidales bacterium]
MKIAGYILIGFLLIRLTVSFINYIWMLWIRSNFINPQENRVLNNGVTPQFSWSILIPVRNEEDNIAKLLGDIERLIIKPNEVIIFNDGSTDNTLTVIESFIDRLPWLKIINNREGSLPEGWLGKNSACYQLAKAAKGEYLLFLDADVRVGNGIAENYIRYANSNSISLLSVFPKQILPNYESRVSTPIMNWILLSLLPLPLVRYSKWSSFAAANGQFMLFNADRYKDLQPHKQYRSSKAEDIEICRYYKRKGELTATFTGDNSIRCLMYDNIEDAINGFSRNVFYFFGNSRYLTLFFLILTTLTPLYLLIFNGIAYSISSFVIIVLIRITISVAGDQSWLNNVRYLFQQHSLFIQIVLRALHNRRNREQIWKGRNIF